MNTDGSMKIGWLKDTDGKWYNLVSSATVSWDDGNPTYDENTQGTHTFTGTLTLPTGLTNPNNLKARVDVIVEGLPAANGMTATVGAKSTPQDGKVMLQQYQMQIQLQ